MQHMQNNNIPSHLAAIINKRLQEAPRPRNEPLVRTEPIKQVFLGKAALTSDPERSLVSAKWDAYGRLVLQFDTKLRLYIWADATVTLNTSNLPGTTPGTVKTPAYHFMMAG